MSNLTVPKQSTRYAQPYFSSIYTSQQVCFYTAIISISLTPPSRRPPQYILAGSRQLLSHSLNQSLPDVPLFKELETAGRTSIQPLCSYTVKASTFVTMLCTQCEPIKHLKNNSEVVCYYPDAEYIAKQGERGCPTCFAVQDRCWPFLTDRRIPDRLGHDKLKIRWIIINKKLIPHIHYVAGHPVAAMDIIEASGKSVTMSIPHAWFK